MDLLGLRCCATRNVRALATVVAVLFAALLASAELEGAERNAVPIKVLAPRHLPGMDIAAVRTPLGLPNDYKPWLARLPDGQLLMVAFCFGGEPSNELPAGTPYLNGPCFGGLTMADGPGARAKNGQTFMVESLP